MAPQKPIVRFAPSPTGTLHTGGARTALFNYLFARQQGGKFILRIDDTDQARSTKEYEQDIVTGLAWLGLGYDELYYQSQRRESYERHLKQLLLEEKAYLSKEPAKPARHASQGDAGGEGGGSVEVIRFKNPRETITFTDLIRGEISVDSSDLGDFVIAKDLQTPLYHFASVVDDYELGITHLIRGEDHISNTPRQILLWRALGAPLPQFAHLPLMLAPDRTKLSKRKHANIASINEFIKQGFLPEALLNFLALLGWNPGTEQEIFSLEELIKVFDLSKVQKGAAVFNLEKLEWFNREYLKRLDPERLITQIRQELPRADHELATRLVPEILSRITTFGELKALAEAGEFDYYFNPPHPTHKQLKTTTHLARVTELVNSIPANQFTAETVKSRVWDFATEVGRSEVLWPMRVALTGRDKSPDPFTVAAILGKEETIARLAHAQGL